LAGVGIAVFAIGCWIVRHRQLVTDVANGLVMAVMGVLCCLRKCTSVHSDSYCVCLIFNLFCLPSK